MPASRLLSPSAVPTTSVPRSSATAEPKPAHSEGNGLSTTVRSANGGAASKIHTRPTPGPDRPGPGPPTARNVPSQAIAVPNPSSAAVSEPG